MLNGETRRARHDKVGHGISVRRAEGKKNDIKPTITLDTGFDVTGFVRKSRRPSPSFNLTARRQVNHKQQGREHTSDSELGHDELDLFSNETDEDGCSGSDRITAKGNEGVKIMGKTHQFHPNFPPNLALKSLKFKKNRNLLSSHETTHKPSVTSQQKLNEFPMDASPSCSSITRNIQNFPPLSPSPVAREFPMLSPLGASSASPNRNSSGSPDDITYSSSSSQDSIQIIPTKLKGTGKKKPRDVKPFPLKSQLHDTLSLTINSTRDNREGRRKTEIDMALNSMDHLDSFDHDDSVLLPCYADPNTLCPYCDAPLPSSPTTHLRRLLSATAKRACSDPRPSNPLGLKAPLTVFGVVCQRHRFESQVLPLAEANGWPQEIDWQSLPKRIQKMKSHLNALIRDTHKSQKECTIKSARCTPTPRSKCIFWIEIMEQIKKKGSRAVSGMREQFATFEKTQPGYYGELGSVVIFQTLVNMFPAESFYGASISPFSVNEFIQRILLPEVATRLIMEDQSLNGQRGVERAVSILRESSSYGVSMFPEDSGEWNASTRESGSGAKVGDLIVMERAKRRRKELDKELSNSEGDVDLSSFDTTSPVQPPAIAKKQLKSKYVYT
ncbi:RTC4-like domain-containing protein [Cyathus striatus]|nr:RTC4-like domain-containing protein [Cyathus striatus]